MARVPAGLPAGVRLSDHVSLGVIARTFPIEEVRRVLAETGKASERERDLPAHVTVYYAVALALYTTAGTREVLRRLLEGLRWLWGAEAVRVAGKSGIPQARTRLGEAPLRRLYERLGRPGAAPPPQGAGAPPGGAGGPGRGCAACTSGWRAGWRRPPPRARGTGGGGRSAWTGPAWTSPTRRRTRPPSGGRAPAAARARSRRSVALVENGTRVLFGARPGSLADGETTLAPDALTALRPGMPCLADRQFFGHALWREAVGTGADLLWRVKRDLRLPRETRLADGSCLTTIYPGEKDRRHRTDGVRVRVVECRLEGAADAEPLCRLVTTVLDPAAAPAAELAALCHERWGIEGALAELKPQLRGARGVLRSRTPELVRQEVRGLLLGHFAVRGLMHEAALRADEDPDRLSFLHAVRVVRRKLPVFAALPPSGQGRPA